jgi:ribokinase
MDLLSYMERLPVAGETIIGTAFQTGYGGKGANQCVATAKLGALSTMVSAVGQDGFGNEFLNAFQNLHINTDKIKVCEKGISTGVAPIWVDAKGENSIVVIPGANLHVDPSMASTGVETSSPATKCLLTQLEIPFESTLAAMETARKRNIVTIFSPAPAPSTPLPLSFFSNASILVPNCIELGMLVNIDTRDKSIEKIKQAAGIILERGCGAIVATLGAQGCVVMVQGDSDPVFINAAKPPAPVIDTTGAGDAFAGSLAYFYSCLITNSSSSTNSSAKNSHNIDKEKLLDAVRRASYYAADSVTKKGTQSSMAVRNELPSELFNFSTEWKY